MGRRRRRRRSSNRPAPENRTRDGKLIPGTGRAVMDTFMTGGRGATGSQTPEQKEKAMFERFRAQLGDTGVNRQTPKDIFGRDNMMHNFNQVNPGRQIQPSETGKFSTQAGLERLKANRPDFMKPRPMTNQGNIANNMAQTAQAQSAQAMINNPYKARKGGQSPVGGKGGQRPAPRPMNSSMPPPRPMGGGGKGSIRPVGKGAQRPTPIAPGLSRPNPQAGGVNTAQAATNMMADRMKNPNISMPSVALKKAPSFKMKSGNSTTFKEMGSSKKKSAPVKKASRGYKMPGFGKR